MREPRVITVDQGADDDLIGQNNPTVTGSGQSLTDRPAWLDHQMG